MVTFQTCSATQTTFDTVLGAYTGTAVNALTLVLINDDTVGCAVSVNANYGSRVSFSAIQGTTYHLQVDGYASNTGSFLLTWAMTSSFTITKTASVASISAPGVIAYTITVANTGTTVLTGMTISDTLLLGATTKTLTSGPSLSSGDTNSNGNIDIGETFIYTATYNVTQADIDTGGTFSNRATYTTAQTAAVTSNAATTVITQSPNFTVTKSQTAGANPVTSAGQSITYTITVANTGNTSLTSPTISDTLLLGAVSRTLTSGPTLTAGDTTGPGILNVGETWVYSASYTVTQADLDATGNVSNTATFATTQVPAKNSTAVTTPVTRSPSLRIVKSWAFATPGGDVNGNGTVDAGDVVTYSFVVTNNGNVTLRNVFVTENFSGAGVAPVPSGETLSDTLPLGDSSDTIINNGIWSILGVGDIVTFKGNYTVLQADVDHG